MASKIAIPVSLRLPEETCNRISQLTVELSENASEPISDSRVIRNALDFLDSFSLMDVKLILARPRDQRKECMTLHDKMRRRTA